MASTVGGRLAVHPRGVIHEEHPQEGRRQQCRHPAGATPPPPPRGGSPPPPPRGARPDGALEPLERAVTASPDPEATLLLARLYDQRDRSDRAIAHLHRLLERDPSHPEATRLLDKLERERRAEAGYRKDETAHFVVKDRGTRGAGRRRGGA